MEKAAVIPSKIISHLFELDSPDQLEDGRGRGKVGHTAAANFGAITGSSLARADARVEGLVPGAATLVEVEGGHVDVGGWRGRDGHGGGQADHREDGEERELHFEMSEISGWYQRMMVRDIKE